MLAEDIARTYAQYLSTSRGQDTPEHRAKIYHRLVLQVNPCSDVQWITERETCGVFHLGGICPKTDQLVLEVLQLKHPGTHPLTASRFEAYGVKLPEFVQVEITDKTVASAARQLLGSAGSVGTDSVSLQHCLLQFRVASAGLRHIVGGFGE